MHVDGWWNGRASGVERPWQGREQAGRVQLALRRYDDSRILPNRGRQFQDQVRRIRARLRKVLRERGVAGRGRGAAESGWRVVERSEGESTEDQQTDREGSRWAGDNSLGYLAPPTLLGLACDDLRRPEHGTPEDREQRRQQRQ